MTRKEQIWVIDDDHAIRWVLEKALQRDDMAVKSFDSAVGVIEALRTRATGRDHGRYPDAGMNGLELLARAAGAGAGVAGHHHDRPFRSR
jgi:two-component system nitrogen regulation response regulator GlnG